MRIHRGTVHRQALSRDFRRASHYYQTPHESDRPGTARLAERRLATLHDRWQENQEALQLQSAKAIVRNHALTALPTKTVLDVALSFALGIPLVSAWVLSTIAYAGGYAIALSAKRDSLIPFVLTALTAGALLGANLSLVASVRFDALLAVTLFGLATGMVAKRYIHGPHRREDL